MMKRILLLFTLSVYFSAVYSNECINEITTFYTNYMMNTLKGHSNNKALCEMYLSVGLNYKIQKMVSAHGIDPIIRAQDINSAAIESLKVREVAENWYMVSYQWNENDGTTLINIPLKTENIDGKCKIIYITPIGNGDQYGNELLSCFDSEKPIAIDETDAKSFVESFYKAYMSSYCNMDKNIDDELSLLRSSYLSNTALEAFNEAALQNLYDGLNGYDLLINNFYFDCMWFRSLTFNQISDNDFQVNYRTGSGNVRINVNVRFNDNKYLIDSIVIIK